MDNMGKIKNEIIEIIKNTKRKVLWDPIYKCSDERIRTGEDDKVLEIINENGGTNVILETIKECVHVVEVEVVSSDANELLKKALEKKGFIMKIAWEDKQGRLILLVWAKQDEEDNRVFFNNIMTKIERLKKSMEIEVSNNA